MMNSLIRRASSFMGLSSDSVVEQTLKIDDREVIFCKNNVCVHPPSLSKGDKEHHPGYLTIKTHHSETSNSTLVLSWIPNASIKRNPRSLENRTPTNSPCHSSRSSACASPRKSPRHSLSSIHSSTNLPAISLFGIEKAADDDLDGQSSENITNDCLLEDGGTSYESPAVEEVEEECSQEVCVSKSKVDSGIGSETVSVNALETSDAVEKNDGSNKPVFTCDIELVGDLAIESNASICPEECSLSSSHSNDLSENETKFDVDKLLLKKDLNLNLQSFSSLQSYDRECYESRQNCQTSTQSILDANSHDLNDFEDVAQHVNKSLAFDKTEFCDTDSLASSTSPSQKCSTYSSFSIDLCQMKSLRLLFNNHECTCGQLVIASRDRHYKILHFHHGGLDKLASIFEDLDFLTKSKICSLPYRLFSVSRPVVSDEECHPEEGLYCTVDETIWESHLNELGQIEDEFVLKKAIFFGGINSNMRSEIWPFLLHCYPFLSTYERRRQIREEHEFEYEKVNQRRENLSNSDKNLFYRNIQCTVEKDVIRTDRSHPFFAGQNNPNVEIMKKILLNYAIYNPSIGYTQGMSDILAPILIEIRDEVETFWCFVGLMQRTIFVSSPTDGDMDLHLNYIRELLHVLVPDFYNHLLSHPDHMELLFCHRWILLCFKREFSEAEALKMWEACWVQFESKYFHLFLCVAIVAIYSEDVIQQDMNADEMLLYFSSLAMHMNGDLVLRKARGLLYQYLHLPNIPLTLAQLCPPIDN